MCALAFILAACEGPVGPQGIQGEKGDKGERGADGVSFVWKGEFASAPADAQFLWAYFNTTTGNAYIYNGSSWNILARSGAAGTSGASILWKGELSSHPANPQLNWAYHNSVNQKSYIYDGLSWVVLAQDGQIGPTGPKGATGNTGTAGTSFIWRGEFAAPPANPQYYWAYFNTTDGNTYIYNGSSWNILAKSGASIVWKGDLAQAPANPRLNWAYYNTADKKLYIYDGSNWAIMAQDGAKGETGNTGPAGTSVVWKGALNAEPGDAELLWVYFNTIDGNAYIYNGSSWDILTQSGASIEWKGNKTEAPADPQLNWAYYNSTNKKSYIYNGQVWQILAQDGAVGPEGPNGISIVWMGELASPLADPQLNWAYYNTADKKSYIYNGQVWQILAQDGEDVAPMGQITVSFNSNGGTTEAVPAVKTVASPAINVGVLPTPPAKTGYLFAGWYTLPDGLGTAFTAATFVSGSLMVYAKWDTYSYTVTFNRNGGDTDANPITKIVISPATIVDSLPAPPVWSNYDFLGWNTQPNGSGTLFTAATIVSGDITVYARWSRANITFLDPDEGDGAFAGGGFTLSKSANGSRIISITGEGYTKPRWLVDGTLKGTDTSLTIAAADYRLGPHNLSLLVTKNNVTWSRDIIFTVEN